MFVANMFVSALGIALWAAEQPRQLTALRQASGTRWSAVSIRRLSAHLTDGVVSSQTAQLL